MERSLQILLADNDEEIIHKTITSYLKDSGHSVDRVHDGPSAIEAVGSRDYDVAFIDLRMLGMDGFSLLTSLQNIRPDMPVVTITGYEDMETAIHGLKLGATDFLSKPIKLLELDAALEKSVRRRALYAQRREEREGLQVDHDSLQTGTAIYPVSFIFLLIGCLIAALLPALVPAEGALQEAIAGRIYAEKAQQESERRYRKITENVNDVVWLMDTKFRFTYINPAVTGLLGYAVEEAMGKTWEQLAAPGCHEGVKRVFAEELARASKDEEDPNKLQIVRMQLVCKDGSDAWVEVKCTALRSPDGQPMGLLVMLHKIAKSTEMASARYSRQFPQDSVIRQRG